jgi:hypothetical protein
MFYKKVFAFAAAMLWTSIVSTKTNVMNSGLTATVSIMVPDKSTTTSEASVFTPQTIQL